MQLTTSHHVCKIQIQLTITITLILFLVDAFFSPICESLEQERGNLNFILKMRMRDVPKLHWWPFMEGSWMRINQCCQDSEKTTITRGVHKTQTNFALKLCLVTIIQRKSTDPISCPKMFTVRRRVENDQGEVEFQKVSKGLSRHIRFDKCTFEILS